MPLSQLLYSFIREKDIYNESVQFKFSDWQWGLEWMEENLEDHEDVEEWEFEPPPGEDDDED